MIAQHAETIARHIAEGLPILMGRQMEADASAPTLLDDLFDLVVEGDQLYEKILNGK